MPTLTLNDSYPWTLFSVYRQSGFLFTHASFNTVTNLWGMPGSRTTSSDPQWKDKILAGVNASQPYSVRQLLDWKVKRMALVCSSPAINIDLSTSEMTFAGHTSIATGVTDETLRDIALARLKRKLSNEVKSFESLVPLAEARDLGTTVRGAVDLTTSLVHDLIEIKRTKGKSAIRYASKAWLTYGFGIRPILEDISNLTQAISSYLHREDRYVRLVGGSSKTWYSNLPVSTVTFNRLARAVANTSVRNTLSYKYVAGYSLPLRSANNYGAHQHFGTDLPSLVPALWEATTASWIVDYFGTVGDYLSDVFEAPSGVPKYITLNRLYTAQFDCKVTPLLEPDALVISRVDGSASGTYLEFDRLLPNGNALPSRLLRFRTGDEIANYGVSKLLNLASILGTKLK